MVDAREMKKILRNNGYEYQRCKGSHFMYSNGVYTVAVNKDLNAMVRILLSLTVSMHIYRDGRFLSTDRIRLQMITDLSQIIYQSLCVSFVRIITAI